MINYALEGPKWADPVVTWSFASAAGGLFTNPIGAPYQSAIRAAAAQWSAVANVTLQEVAPGAVNTDITVGWGSFTARQIGETDYSYQTGSSQTFLPGMTIRIEDPALLSLASTAGAVWQGTATTLLQVALHEFGHALGLGLSSDPNSVMNLALGPSNTTIEASDLAGIAALYGTSAQIAAQTAGRTVIQAAAPGTDTVALGGDTIGVYRFFDSHNGTQFLTSSVGEMTTIFASRPDLRFEGLAMAGVPAGSANATPMYRFYDGSNGTHFFTTSATEAATIGATRPDMIAEQSTFSEHVIQQAGDVPVYRFFNNVNGMHFFTADTTERATIIATRPDMVAEGIAFYAPAS